MKCKDAFVGQRVMYWRSDMTKDDFGTVVAPDAWGDDTQIRVEFDDGKIECFNAKAFAPIPEGEN